MRKMVIKLQLWGEPVAVIGELESVREWIAYLLRHPGYGLRPVVAFCHCETSSKIFGNIFIRPYTTLPEICKQEFVGSALILSDGWGKRYIECLGAYQGSLNRVILVNPEVNPQSIWMSLMDFGGIVGLVIQHDLLNRGIWAIKRLIDVVGSVLGLILLTPVFLVIALLIKLDSSGPVIFRQWRLGKEGKPFQMVKFRTMYSNAEEMLEESFAKNPELKWEWERYQKLKNDPRITKIGFFLRQFSMDELPQLWNVLKGEMSLVGPRPFFSDQLKDYGEVFGHYVLVRPGITGMWQVSGRNRTSFAERAQWDQYYVRNWSFWLEIYILARTVWVVLKREGAY
jgi:Undecaprenyl-phosphate galactose phosphotransferase WbaP